MTALIDAWRTIVPRRDDRHGPLPPMLLVLTVVTGLVDAFSYLSLGHVFVANMTGNVVFLGFSIAGAAGFSAGSSVTALASFAAGALIGGRAAHRGTKHRGRLLLVAVTVQTVLVLAAFIAAQVHGAPWHGGVSYPLIVLLGLAMGLQNAAARALAVPDLTTTVLTLTITGIAADGWLAGGAGSRIGRRALSVIAMFGGALVGAVIAIHGSAAVVLVIAAALLLGLAVVLVPLARSRRPWVSG